MTRTSDGLLRLVNDVHFAFARLFNHRAADYGLTRAHWRVMAGLYRHNGLTQTELSTAIAMARSPLGKVIDRLEESGLVERRLDPDDRRVKRLHLTPKADPLVAPARELSDGIEAKALSALPKHRHDELLTDLNAIRTVLIQELEQES